MKPISIFIFRSDLRLQDNLGLIKALKISHKVIPIYFQENLNIFKNKNSNQLQFILESLDDLDKQLKKKNSKLFIFKDIKSLDNLIKKEKVEAIYINQLYHPKHIAQEKKLRTLCKKHKIEFFIEQDHLLHEIAIIKPSGSKSLAYKVFKPFFMASKKIKIEKPKKNNYKNFSSKSSSFTNSISLEKLNKTLKNKNENLHQNGGTKNAQKILRNIKKYKDYKNIKDFPSINGTTKLSAYINNGCVSIREVFYKIADAFGKNHELIRQLFWRDFYYNLYYAYPKLFKTGLKKSRVKWQYNRAKFNKWKNGKTKIELIDAAMNELNTTGFINNRCRMITSNYLTLKLKINWLWGEKYFAEKLTDYDPILNNGNWQFIAQVGTDTSPFLRIFNPELQTKKFDKDHRYINKWL